jgi:TonB family protein
MKSLFEKITTLVFIIAVCFGCKYINLNKSEDVTETTKTKITKDILVERLTKKGVKIFESNSNLKPSPNYLVLKMLSGYAPPKLKLNDSELNFPELVMKLNKIFIEREKNGIFVEGTNEVYKRINLATTENDIAFYNKENILVEDFEKLVDDLHKEKFDQIYLTFSEIPTSNLSEIEKALTTPTKTLTLSDNSNSNKPSLLTVSGGVVNGKAIDLVKPDYPPAARAIRASGAVNVSVVIDEQGNVISASASSGHPLLHSAAVKAAKASKFNPTILSGRAVKVTGVIVYNFSPTQ